MTSLPPPDGRTVSRDVTLLLCQHLIPLGKLETSLSTHSSVLDTLTFDLSLAVTYTRGQMETTRTAI